MQSRVELGLRWVVGLGLIAALEGCGSLQSVSSGQIGCAEEDIVITDDEGGIGTRTWVASCHGRKFFCTAFAGNDGSQVNCKEELASGARRNSRERQEMVRRPESNPPPRADPEVNGCQYDTQCKGDRVCDDGECIAPRTKARAPTTPADAQDPAP